MANFSIHKTTALPGTLDPDSIYIVSTGAPLAEIYITDTAGSARRVVNSDDIQNMIDTSLAGISGGATIVDDIAERDGLSASNGQTVLVLDATSDATVDSGAATYIYRTTGSTWVKLSEAESIDVSLTWASITGKPSSSVANIDDAVTKRHNHSNKTQLDQIDQDEDGNLTYNGSLPKTAWGTTGW